MKTLQSAFFGLILVGMVRAAHAQAPAPAPAAKSAPAGNAGFYDDDADTGVLRDEDVYEGQTPDVHVVRTGDTLWDICGYYFNDSWQWPKVWGYNTALWAGLVMAALILPVFYYRHYIQDGGRFPKGALEDLGLKDGDMGERKAGFLPYLALIAGAAVVLWANWFFVLPA